MNIIIEKVKYKNFLSVGNIPLEFDLTKQRNTLVNGKNGTSKTGIFEAIYFALYGKPLRKVPKGNLINNINKKNLEVELRLTSNNKRYIIKRNLKPNLFEIYENNKLIDQTSLIKDYQDLFEENILGITPQAFKQIILFRDEILSI